MRATSHSSPWSDERVDRLKKMWADGLTASQIADKLGGVSRSAICAKILRLGLKGRSEAAKNAANVRATKRRQEVEARQALRLEARRAKAPPVKRAPYQGGGHNFRGGRTGFTPCPDLLPEINAADDVARVRLFDLKPSMCKWPIGDPRSASFGFCGDHAPDGPYCSGHAARAYTAPKPKEPKTGNELMRALRRWI